MGNYKSAHLHTSSSISSHTYTSEAHDSSSTIDHILVPEYLLSNFSSCRVIEDDPLNLSDHSPICVSLQVSLLQTPSRASQSGSPQFRPNWSKLSSSELLLGYTVEVESQLAKLPPPDLCSLISSPSSIDSLLVSVTEILHSAARLHVPARRYLPFLKPGWTPELKRAHTRSKKLYKEWVRCGRPRCCTNPKRRRFK